MYLTALATPGQAAHKVVSLASIFCLVVRARAHFAGCLIHLQQLIVNMNYGVSVDLLCLCRLDMGLGCKVEINKTDVQAYLKPETKYTTATDNLSDFPLPTLVTAHSCTRALPLLIHHNIIIVIT